MRKLVGLCLFTLASLPALASIQFGPRQDLGTDLHKLGYVAVADFNGDGKLDLAVTSSSDPTLLVYLNKGDGTFAAPLSVQLSTQQNFATLFAGDFDEDGKQDLVVTTLSGQQEAIFLSGNGDGTFTQGATIPNSGSFLNAAVVDFNHDGHLDLVTANNGNLTVYLGDGHGNFAAQPFLGPGGAFFGLTVADFNKDNHLDIVTGEYTYGSNAYPELGIRFYAGNGDGSVQTPTYSTASYILSPFQFASADFDGDGNLDVLFSQPDYAMVLFGNGDGTFKLSQSATASFYIPVPDGTAEPIAPPLVAAADMNADGKPDGIIADLVANSINVFINDGTSAFYNAATFSAPLDAGTSAMQIADLNGDGLPDIILTNVLTQKISIFLSIRTINTPSLTLTPSASQALVGAPLTFTATVAASPSGQIPTGSVTLLDGTTTLGQQTLDATGKTIFSLGSLAVGPHALSFSYSGDPNFKPAVSSVLTETITDFQVALPTSAQTVKAGSPATFNLTITPTAGLAGTATVSCSGLPSSYTCPPVTSTLNGLPVTATLTIGTPSATGQLVPPFARRIHTALFGLPSLLLACLFLRRSRQIPAILALCLLTLGIAGITGCSSHSPAPTTPAPVTTAFTITTSVTQGGQTVTHSIGATLTVD